MNIKKRIPKFLSLLLCFSMTFGNMIPAYAMENTSDNSTTVIDGGNISTEERNLEDITVTYKQASSFFVTIPKTIVLDGWKQSTYSVKVSGDIGSEQCVYVAPIDMIDTTENIDFYMQDQASENAKDDVVASVTHNKFHWNSTEVAGSYKQDDNVVSAPDLTAGAWKGIFQMEIKLETHVTHKHNYVETITKEPTCTETGEKTYTCDCGNSYTEVIPAKGHHYGDDDKCTDCGELNPAHRHSYTEKITKEPTCTEKGEKTYTCKCGDSYTEEIPAKGHHYENGECTDCGEKDPNHTHSYDEGVVTKEPTCTEKGEKTFTCSGCGHTYTEEIPAKGHHYGDDDKCTDCGELNPDHTHSYDEGVVTKEPTCTEKGEKTFTCSGCGHTYTEEIPAKGHNYENNVCINCGEIDPSHTHSYVPYVFTVEPTLVSSVKNNTASGTREWVLSATNDEYNRYYTSVIHTKSGCATTATFEINMPDDYEGDFDYKYGYACSPNSSAANSNKQYVISMTLNGNLVYQNYKGSISGSASNNTTIPLKAGKNTFTVQYSGRTTLSSYSTSDTSTATLTLYKCPLYDGTQYHICNECGKKEKHSFDEGVVTKEATCTEAGEKTYTCNICEGEYIEEIPARGHNFVNGICTMCGEANVATTEIYSISATTSRTTDSGHGHYDQTSLSGTYSPNIEIAGDMTEDEYLVLNSYMGYPVISGQGQYGESDGINGSAQLQKYDEATGTWKTIDTHSMSYKIAANITDQVGGYKDFHCGCGISRKYQLEKGTYRIYGAFSAHRSCASSVAHYYYSYRITAYLCQIDKG